MTTLPLDTFADLRRAIAAREKARTAAIIAVMRTVFPAGSRETDAELALKELIGARWFDLAVACGRILIGYFPEAVGIRRRYAQALIERNEFAEAREHLELLLARPAARLAQRAEYLGSIGRTYKQQFVNREREAGQLDEGALRLAIDTYLRGYRLDEDRNTWHGINVVALQMLAQRRCLGVTGDPQALASQIVDTLRLAQGRTHWDEATLAEAYLALGAWEEAAPHLRAYLWYPRIEPFAVAATLRQLEEIWQFSDSAGAPGGEFVTLLRARLIELEEGCVRLKPADVKTVLAKADKHYEKVFGTDHFTTLANFRTGLDRCGPVARIGLDMDRGEGTGFLVRGSDLDPRLGADAVLVTNAHVIDPTPDRRNEGLPPCDVKITFQALPGVAATQVFTVRNVIWTSERENFDTTIVRLDPPPPLPAPYPIASTVPAKGARVIAIGHPGGGTLSFSLNDNELIDFEQPGSKVHYRTPTEGGSSGCPIFTREWKLLALHHVGGDEMQKLNGAAGTYQANEGIAIHAIRAALAKVASFE